MILTSYNLYCGELFSIPGKNIILFFFLFIGIKAILNTQLGCIFLSILEPLEAPALFAFQVFTFSSPFKRQSFLRVSSFQVFKAILSRYPSPAVSHSASHYRNFTVECLFLGGKVSFFGLVTK